MKNLITMCIRGVANDWFRYYLDNQKQYVTLNGPNSSIKPLSTGVPQGSVLGLFLLLVYINDLCKCAKHSEIYHINTNILPSHSSILVLILILILDLKVRKLSLNVIKIELIIFHSSYKKINHSLKFRLDGKRLTPSSTVKYLGVFLDDHLLWSKHLL